MVGVDIAQIVPVNLLDVSVEVFLVRVHQGQFVWMVAQSKGMAQLILPYSAAAVTAIVTVTLPLPPFPSLTSTVRL